MLSERIIQIATISSKVPIFHYFEKDFTPGGGFLRAHATKEAGSLSDSNCSSCIENIEGMRCL